MTLYNLRSDGTITKWDADGNIQAQYSVSEDGCTCPAGHRHICRHRQMLPDLLPIADTHWFWDWTYKQVTDFQGHPKYLLDKLTEPASVDLPAEQDTPPLPDGIQMFNLAETSPADLFNAIAEAVGEPLHQPTKTWRRL